MSRATIIAMVAHGKLVRRRCIHRLRITRGHHSARSTIAGMVRLVLAGRSIGKITLWPRWQRWGKGVFFSL